MIRTYQGFEPRLGKSAWVDDTALVVGDVTLHEDVSIWPMAVVRGDVNRIEIGARSNIQDGSVVHVAHDGPFSPGGFPTEIGEDVTVGHRALVHACVVGSRVLVGMGATIMDGAVVEDDIVLAAGALVPPGKRLQGGHLYVGAPVRQQRALTEREREHLVYSAHHYVRVKRRHQGLDDGS